MRRRRSLSHPRGNAHARALHRGQEKADIKGHRVCERRRVRRPRVGGQGWQVVVQLLQRERAHATWQFWRTTNGPDTSAWWEAVTLVALLLPSSAEAERFFSRALKRTHPGRTRARARRAPPGLGPRGSRIKEPSAPPIEPFI